jgi:hypothetical protein
VCVGRVPSRYVRNPLNDEKSLMHSRSWETRITSLLDFLTISGLIGTNSQLCAKINLGSPFGRSALMSASKTNGSTTPAWLIAIRP